MQKLCAVLTKPVKSAEGAVVGTARLCTYRGRWWAPLGPVHIEGAGGRRSARQHKLGVTRLPVKLLVRVVCYHHDINAKTLRASPTK